MVSLLTFTVVFQYTSHRPPRGTVESWRRGCVSGRNIQSEPGGIIQVKQTPVIGQYPGTAATYDVTSYIGARLRASVVMRVVLDEVVGGVRKADAA
jgi:hypothetical protein